MWLSLNLLEILIFVLTGLIILPTAHNDQRLTDFDDELDQRHRRRRIAVVISGIFIWCVQLLRTALWKTVGKSERVLLRFGLLSLSVGALWAIIVVCMLSDALALKGHCNSGCWIDVGNSSLQHVLQLTVRTANGRYMLCDACDGLFLIGFCTTINYRGGLYSCTIFRCRTLIPDAVTETSVQHRSKSRTGS